MNFFYILFSLFEAMSQEADDETNYYEVEAILDKREFSTGAAEYLIKWKGYSEEWYSVAILCSFWFNHAFFFLIRVYAHILMRKMY